MPSITIRDVPKGVRDELAGRAALSGQSFQQWLRGHLLELASRPDQEQVLARIRTRKLASGTRLTTDEVLAWRDADRR